MSNQQNQQSLPESMENFKNKYYSENKKNTLFKKSQKLDCALQLSRSPEFNLELALQNTVFIMSESNCVFLNYEIFKYYGNPENYEQIVNYIISLILLCISKYEKYEFHVNLNSFTISAVERYMSIIKIFSDTCLSQDTQFSILLDKLVIYNTPTVINDISKLLKSMIDPIILTKIQLNGKTDIANMIRNQKN
jgi:hypothetical protein